MDINLYKYYKNNGRVEKNDFKKIIQGMASGIKYIHSFDIIHGDLKPENVMINFINMETKIIDFGSSFLKKI